MPFEISRKVIVPDTVTMEDLHLVIQVSMGWENYHLYQFSDRKGRDKTIEVRESEEDFNFWTGVRASQPNKTSLKTEFFVKRNAKPLFYWYDFGDDWWHKISFQKPSKKDLDAYQGIPICVEAKGACPPEDVGGPWGFHEFFETVNDKKSPEGKEFRDWMGLEKDEAWDFESVNLPAINSDLGHCFL